MPNATCLINGQTLATQGTTGINVSGGSTITIKLANTSGVTSWSINCTNADGRNPNSAPALINATKSVDPVNFSATFTAPNTSVVDGYLTGAALQFTSIVNIGEWNQNTVTMGVFVVGPLGVRMVFNGETFESDATYGVSADINALNDQVFAVATSTGAGVIQLTNDLGGTYNAPVVVQLSGSGSGVAVPVGSYLKYGNAPAQTGAIRFSNNVSMQARNAANTQDISIAIVDSSNNVTLGDTAHAGSLSIGASGPILVQPNGTTSATHTSSALTLSVPSLLFANTVSAPTIKQNDLTTNGATAQTLTIHAQNETGTTSTGGGLTLASGTGTTQAGNVVIKTGTTQQINILPTEMDLATSGSITVMNGGRAEQTSATDTSADYTIDTTGGVKDYVVICKFTSSHLINLPSPATYIGRSLIIKVTGSISSSVTCTLHRNATENIDGLAADYVITAAWACVRLVTDGSDWFIIS